MNAKKSLILNTWGVLIYFFAQWLLTILVTKISGYEAAGKYSLAVSFTNVFSFIGMFGVRSLQASDVERKYSDGQYFALRGVTCLLALVVFFLALLVIGYEHHIVLCCIAMMSYKILESVQDVLVGSLQRNQKFDCIAVTYTIKAVLVLAAFTLMLYLGQPIYMAIAAMVVVFIAVVCFYDIPQVRKNAHANEYFSLKGTISILRESFPLMLTALLDALLIYIPRDAVERVLGSEELGYYSTVSIVVVVLSTLGSGVWGSIMPRISAFIYAKEHKVVEKIINVVAVAMIVVSVAVISLGSLLGPFFFRIVFGPEILNYMFLLVPVLINALLLLANSFYQCVLIPLKQRNVLLYTDTVAAAACLILSNIFVRNWGLVGACLGLTFSLALRCILLAVILWRIWTKNKKEDNLCIRK